MIEQLFGASAATKDILGVTDYHKATWTQNFIASVAGAVASITVAAPLDTIKTRIQNEHWMPQTTVRPTPTRHLSISHVRLLREIREKRGDSRWRSSHPAHSTISTMANTPYSANDTHDIVVLAADGLGTARIAGADTDDGDGRAVEADEHIDTLDDDAEETEEEARRRIYLVDSQGLIYDSRGKLAEHKKCMCSSWLSLVSC